MFIYRLSEKMWLSGLTFWQTTKKFVALPS
uniref:Uncharacterized protein n=1 Tax=Arundo donax TaxID=35708 RepID=A0A0A9HH90_ARUDO